jgi:hypothetical protein
VDVDIVELENAENRWFLFVCLAAREAMTWMGCDGNVFSAGGLRIQSADGGTILVPREYPRFDASR